MDRERGERDSKREGKEEMSLFIREKVESRVELQAEAGGPTAAVTN